MENFKREKLSRCATRSSEQIRYLALALYSRSCYRALLALRRDSIVERFTALAFVEPDRQDYIDAAEVRNTCRRNGVQIGTIDALLIQLSRRHDLQVLTTDNDFRSASLHIEFRLWGPTHG